MPFRSSSPFRSTSSVRRGGARLHDVDQRLAAGEGAGAVVLPQDREGLGDGRRLRVFDLPQQHVSDPTHRRKGVASGILFLPASGSAWMRVLARRLSGPPARPARTASISASIESAVSAGDSAPMSRPHGPAMRSSVRFGDAGLAQQLAPALLVAPRAERADVERVASRAPPVSIGTSNLSSWVRTTIAVPTSGRTWASASSGHATSSSSALGIRSRRREPRARVGDDRRPAEQLRGAAERLGRVDRAVDEQARRRRRRRRRRPSAPSCSITWLRPRRKRAPARARRARQGRRRPSCRPRARAASRRRRRPRRP